jgi:hypothetical protein
MKIKLRGIAATRKVWLDGVLLSEKASLKVRNHSPDGFNWGYAGSGCAQLALAICLKIYGEPNNYQKFKFKYITPLPFGEDFDVELEVPDAPVFMEDSNDA